MLRDRLALASFKSKRGLAQLPLTDVVPRLEDDEDDDDDGDEEHADDDGVVRKRQRIDDGSSSIQQHIPDDSASEAASDEAENIILQAYQPRHSLTPSRLSARQPGRYGSQSAQSAFGLGLRLHQPTGITSSWSSTVRAFRRGYRDGRALSQTSPVHRRKRQHFAVTFGSDPPLSMDEQSLDGFLDGPPPPPMQGIGSPAFPSPRTPSPRRRRPARLGNGHGLMDLAPGHEGADLLLHFAKTPPSKPTGDGRARPREREPVTPSPSSRNPAPPSTVLTTPTGGNFIAGFAAHPDTPGAPINWADFLHDSPMLTSAATRPSRTPKLAAVIPSTRPTPGRVQTSPDRVMTPAAAKEACETLASDMAPPPPPPSSSAGRAEPTTPKRSTTNRPDHELGGVLPR